MGFLIDAVAHGLWGIGRVTGFMPCDFMRYLQINLAEIIILHRCRDDQALCRPDIDGVGSQA